MDEKIIIIPEPIPPAKPSPPSVKETFQIDFHAKQEDKK